MTITPEERKIFRSMTPPEKLSLISQFHMQARTWKKAALKAQHRDWSTEQLEHRVREIFLYGTS